MQAITPGDDIYNYKFNLQKKSNISNNRHQNITNLPSIKSYKDQMTGTKDVRTCINFNNKKQNINETTLMFNFLKNDSSPTSITNMITNNNNNINPNFVFNRNNKLKSIPQQLKKSNSIANMNLIHPNKIFNVLSIPGNQVKNKVLKQSTSQPKLAIKQEYFENNKCNYLMLKYTGIDNSKNDIKKKKYLLIHSHKVIDSLKQYSMPNDIYGTKLVDVIQQRINSGFYQNYKFNFSQKYQKIEISPSTQNFGNNYRVEEQKNNEKKYSGNFLKDIYDKFLLPGPDNKYNYTVHKIFLSHVLEKVCKKMVEVRDKKNKVITKEEIRKEFGNEVDNLRKNILTGTDFNIINKIYNINNDLNIINIDLGRNYLKFNDMDVIDESQEPTLLKNTSLDDRDKDKQDLTLNGLSAFDKSNISEINKKQTLEKIESKYKIIHKENNSELLFNIKNTMNLSNQNFSIHDSFMNLYFKKLNLDSIKYKSMITSNKIYSKRNAMSPSDTRRTYIEQEEELNNVEKFILNTKKLRYALNIKEYKDKRNLSFDSEGNIKNYFEVGLKLNPVFFDDIYDELEEQYNKNNHIKEKFEKNKLAQEILQYYLNKKGIHLKFNDKITQKYLSFLIKKESKKKRKQEKVSHQGKNKKKEERKIIQEIAKLIHKKINIKIGRNISTKEGKRKADKNRKNNTEDNFWQKNNYRNKNSEFYSINPNINQIQLTDNNYLEIETNSSEFSDLPSELDSEVYEMVKKKQEQKNRDKDLEEGIYSTNQKGGKNKGGDFIITRPQNLNKEKKAKKEEEEKKILEEKRKAEEIDNKGNLNNFLKIDEKGEIETKKKEKVYPDKEKEKIKEKNIIKSKDEDIKKTQTIQKPKIIDDTNKDKKKKEKEKIKVNYLDEKNKKIINKKINKSISDDNETNTSKIKKFDTSTNKITSTTKTRSDIESRNSIINKLEKKAKAEVKPSNIDKDKTKEKEKNAKDKKLPDIINKHQRNLAILEPLYKDIKLDKGNTSEKEVNNKDKPYYSLNNDLKNISPTLDDKNNINNINDSSINPTSDHLSIVGVMNIINTKEKTPSNKSNEGKKIGEEEFEFKEDEEIIKAQTKQNTSFYNDSKNNKILKDIVIKNEKETTKRNRGDSPIINQRKNFLRIIYFLEKYNKEHKRFKKGMKKGDRRKDDSDEKSNLSYNSLEEENEEQKEERKKRRARKTKGIDMKQFLFDENILKDDEERDKKFSEQLPLILPKKEPWEDKFKNFKLYINKLKGMNQDEFKNDIFKFLHEEDKIDFGQKERLNMVDRINKYKAFINNSKKNKLLYNRFHSSRILFAPGCIFNTDNIF